MIALLLLLLFFMLFDDAANARGEECANSLQFFCFIGIVNRQWVLCNGIDGLDSTTYQRV